MEHLVRCEVIGDLPIVSVTGYREVEEVQFGPNGAPLFDGEGNPVVKPVRVAETQDVTKGQIAYLDPAETNIAVLTQAQLVKVLPKAKKGA
ncbi:hypothetical protein [Catelliglobosispora koreensis]|uniref:hypothetical protein n=1 Tax=Catelliglobosispora koreensis TaxID=129052 RepID=UPI00036FB70B|nr:hypothetical protein [Catelliglobosispora koreensis]